MAKRDARKSVLAIAAHPDDIEFVMSGTMMRLIELGWEAHYFNLANGCCGSMTLGREECARTRLDEAKNAAAALPAQFYAPICDDMEVIYATSLLKQVASVIRQAAPSVLLTHATQDYMEDHQNAARLAVSGAFVRGIPNFVCEPTADCYFEDVAIYHAQPHGNRDPLGTVVRPELCVDVTDLLERKRQLLEMHRSQSSWLGESQGMDSYVATMEELNTEVGMMSGVFRRAEGWRQHLRIGFSRPGFDPLAEALGEAAIRLSEPK
ncbi:MAG: PIG-L family deacetylase [Planctomycetota bacterium]